MDAATSLDVEDRCRDLLRACPPSETTTTEFLGAQYDAGLAWVHYPPGCGGVGAPREQQITIDAILRAAGAPAPPEIGLLGIGMGSAVVVGFGSAAQKQRYLRPIFTGEEIWCQLFSEPGAGSDVAGLATIARRDGDDWIVNGQKVWSSLAHVARFGMLAARCDPDQPKHLGLVYFIVDMRSPGIEVRPLRQMTGEAEFNEVYFDDVRIPDRERLGEPGDGWSVMLTTLMNERVALGGVVPPKGGGAIAAAIDVWRQRGGGSSLERDRLAQLWIRAEIQRLTAMRSAAERGRGAAGPDGSLGKLAGARLNQDVTEFCLGLLGAHGLLYGTYGAASQTDLTRARAFLRSRANTIEGGTSEVMLNILGERVLGLPGEPRTDRDVPWKDTPR